MVEYFPCMVCSNQHDLSVLILAVNKKCFQKNVLKCSTLLLWVFYSKYFVKWVPASFPSHIYIHTSLTSLRQATLTSSVSFFPNTQQPNYWVLDGNDGHKVLWYFLRIHQTHDCWRTRLSYSILLKKSGWLISDNSENSTGRYQIKANWNLNSDLSHLLLFVLWWKS